jgi:hypothetical protein
MNSGLLDLPGFLLGPVDGLLALLHVPALLRVLWWGALVGYAGMWIYRRWSPQQRIAELRVELAAVQRRLAGYDGEFSGLLPLIRAQFALALRQMRLTAGAAFLAAAPILLVLPWLSNQYDRQFPAAGEHVRICASPAASAQALRWSPADRNADAQGCWELPWPQSGETLNLSDGSLDLLELPTAVPATIVHKRHWLNWLVGNPAGYLPDDARSDSVTLDLAAIDLVPFGPGWMRGWEAAVCLSALAWSLWLRWRWKLN